MTSRNVTVKSLVDGNIGGLLSKPPIRQNKFPAKISSHTVYSNLWIKMITITPCVHVVTLGLVMLRVKPTFNKTSVSLAAMPLSPRVNILPWRDSSTTFCPKQNWCSSKLSLQMPSDRLLSSARRKSCVHGNIIAVKMCICTYIY